MRRFIVRLAALPIRLMLRLYFVFPKTMAARMRRWRGDDGGIVSNTSGQLRHDNQVFAVFVIWQADGVPWFVDNVLAALERHGVNVILASNRPLDETQKLALLPRCHTLLERDNSGFDFGAYRDASLLIAEQHDAARVIYLNDSLYYFKRGLDAFIDRLVNSDADICAAFESWELKQHIQSFAFSMSGAMFKSARVQRFWRSYLPVNSRYWAVRRGEIALSRVMIPNADKIEVIYGPNQVRPKLADTPGTEMLQFNNLLPIPVRMGDEMHRMRGSAFIENLVRRMTLASQVHGGGFIYHCLLDCPIIKRDLVYRMQFTIYDVEQCLLMAGHGEGTEEILSEQRRKGTGRQLPLFKRMLFMDGLI